MSCEEAAGAPRSSPLVGAVVLGFAAVVSSSVASSSFPPIIYASSSSSSQRLSSLLRPAVVDRGEASSFILGLPADGRVPNSASAWHRMASCVDLAKLLWMEIGDVPAAGGHPPISARFEICFSSFAERRACFRLDLAAGSKLHKTTTFGA
jgi:hypothetical protein